MNNIIHMTAARQTQVLHKEYRWPKYGVKSYLQLINDSVFVRAEIHNIPSVQFNRIKYNRMDNAQQEEYERKLDLMVPEYCLYTSGSSFYSVPKLVYDYFVSLHPLMTIGSVAK
jgi:hypothetical protein